MFLAKAVTIVASIGIVVGLIVSSGMQSKKQPEGHIEVTKLNEEYDDWQDQLKSELLSDDALKAEQKAEKKKQKAEKTELVWLNTFVLEIQGFQPLLQGETVFFRPNFPFG